MPRLLAGICAIVLLGGCSINPLGNKGQRLEKIFLLETRADVTPAEVRGQCTVVVGAPEAAPGFNGPGMLYKRSARQVERFAYSRWAESPASMLEPLLLRALRASGEFAGVLPVPAAIAADLRVESDELRLVQVFSGDSSEVQLSMSSRVYAPAERGLLASREFRYAVPASKANPEAGVEAADVAVARLLSDFVAFVREARQSLRTSCGPPP